MKEQNLRINLQNTNRIEDETNQNEEYVDHDFGQDLSGYDETDVIIDKDQLDKKPNQFGTRENARYEQNIEIEANSLRVDGSNYKVDQTIEKKGVDPNVQLQSYQNVQDLEMGAEEMSESRDASVTKRPGHNSKSPIEKVGIDEQRNELKKMKKALNFTKSTSDAQFLQQREALNFYEPDQVCQSSRKPMNPDVVPGLNFEGFDQNQRDEHTNKGQMGPRSRSGGLLSTMSQHQNFNPMPSPAPLYPGSRQLNPSQSGSHIFRNSNNPNFPGRLHYQPAPQHYAPFQNYIHSYVPQKQINYNLQNSQMKHSNNSIGYGLMSQGGDSVHKLSNEINNQLHQSSRQVSHSPSPHHQNKQDQEYEISQLNSSGPKTHRTMVIHPTDQVSANVTEGVDFYPGLANTAAADQSQSGFNAIRSQHQYMQHISEPQYLQEMHNQQQMMKIEMEIQGLRGECNDLRKENALLKQEIDQYKEQLKEADEKQRMLNRQHDTVIRAFTEREEGIQADFDQINVKCQILDEQLNATKIQVIETEEKWRECVSQKDLEIQKLNERLRDNQQELQMLRLDKNRSMSHRKAQSEDFERDLQKELQLQELQIMQRESKKLIDMNQSLQKAEQEVELLRMDYQKQIIDEQLKWNRDQQEKDRKMRDQHQKDLNNLRDKNQSLQKENEENKSKNTLKESIHIEKQKSQIMGLQKQSQRLKQDCEMKDTKYNQLLGQKQLQEKKLQDAEREVIRFKTQYKTSQNNYEVSIKSFKERIKLLETSLEKSEKREAILKKKSKSQQKPLKPVSENLDDEKENNPANDGQRQPEANIEMNDEKLLNISTVEQKKNGQNHQQNLQIKHVKLDLNLTKKTKHQIPLKNEVLSQSTKSLQKMRNCNRPNNQRNELGLNKSKSQYSLNETNLLEKTQDSKHPDIEIVDQKRKSKLKDKYNKKQHSRQKSIVNGIGMDCMASMCMGGGPGRKTKKGGGLLKAAQNQNSCSVSTSNNATISIDIVRQNEERNAYNGEAGRRSSRTQKQEVNGQFKQRTRSTDDRLNALQQNKGRSENIQDAFADKSYLDESFIPSQARQTPKTPTSGLKTFKKTHRDRLNAQEHQANNLDIPSQVTQFSNDMRMMHEHMDLDHRKVHEQFRLAAMANPNDENSVNVLNYPQVKQRDGQKRNPLNGQNQTCNQLSMPMKMRQSGHSFPEGQGCYTPNGEPARTTRASLAGQNAFTQNQPNLEGDRPQKQQLSQSKSLQHLQAQPDQRQWPDMYQNIQQKFQNWQNQMSQQHEQNIQELQIEHCRLESDRKQQYNLSRMLTSKNCHIKEFKFTPDMHQKQQDLRIKGGQSKVSRIQTVPAEFAKNQEEHRGLSPAQSCGSDKSAITAEILAHIPQNMVTQNNVCFRSFEDDGGFLKLKPEAEDGHMDQDGRSRSPAKSAGKTAKRYSVNLTTHDNASSISMNIGSAVNHHQPNGGNADMQTINSFYQYQNKKSPKFNGSSAMHTNDFQQRINQVGSFSKTQTLLSTKQSQPKQSQTVRASLNREDQHVRAGGPDHQTATIAPSSSLNPASSINIARPSSGRMCPHHQNQQQKLMQQSLDGNQPEPQHSAQSHSRKASAKATKKSLSLAGSSGHSRQLSLRSKLSQIQRQIESQNTKAAKQTC